MVKVIGIGDNVVDKYVDIRTMYPGGNALNFSVYAKQLGAESAYMGTFGTDEAAVHIQQTLAEIGVDTTRCRQVEGENGYAMVGLEDGDRVFLYSNNGGVGSTHKLALSEDDLAYIKGYDLVHTSRYSYIEAELEKLKKIGVRVAFDFSDDFTEDYLQDVCPYIDFSFLSCSHLSNSEVRELLQRVYDMGSRIVVATMGSKGAVLYNGTEFYRQQPHLVEAVDTLGAGDSFITAFLLNYIQHDPESRVNIEKSIKESLDKGAALAAKNCMVDGAFGYGLTY